MSNNQLVCQNDKCKGTNFEQISGNTWKCVDCGTMTELFVKRVQKKKKPLKKRKTLSVKNYSPIVLKCESCGYVIDRLTHPRDEKRLNNNWINHVCASQDKFIQ